MSRPWGVYRSLPVILPLALVLASLLTLPTSAQQILNANAKLDGWVTDFGKPSYADPDIYQSHMVRGQELLAKNDFEGAAGEFLECIRLLKPLVEASERRGEFGAVRAMKIYVRPLADATLNLGLTMRGMGRLDTAIKLFQAAADIAPGHWSAHQYLGTALIEKGEALYAERMKHYIGIGQLPPSETELNTYRSAVVHLYVARQLDPNEATNAEVRLQLCRALRLWGDLQRAVAMGREAEERDDEDPRIPYNLGLALAALGDLNGAIDEYSKAENLAKDSPAAFQAQIQDAMGLALAGLGKFTEAAAAYEKAAKLDPSKGAYQNNYGTALRAAGGGAGGALAAHTAARVLEPDSLAYVTNAATVSREINDLDGAAMAYREALRLSPRNPELHHQLGLTLYQRSDAIRTIAGYRSAKEAALDDNAVRYALAVIAVHYLHGRRLKDVDAVDPRSYEVTPRLAIRPNPWPDLTREMGRFWLTLDQRPYYGESRVTLQHDILNLKQVAPTILSLAGKMDRVLGIKAAGAEAIEPLGLPEKLAEQFARDPELAAAVETLPMPVKRATLATALALRHRDDIEEAISELRWARRHDPKSAHIANNLGKALFDNGQVAEALAMYDRAVRIDSGIPEVHFNRGVALGYLGRMDQAYDAWERALALGMKDCRLYNFMGLAWLQCAELDRARAMFTEALVCNPDDAPAHYYMGLVEALAQSASPITAKVLERARTDTPIGRPHYEVRGEFIKLTELEKAMASWSKAEQLDPDRTAMYYYAGVELGLQNPDLAQVTGIDVIHCVTRISKLIPDWAAVTNNMAVVAAQNNDLEKAEKLLRIAVADEPDYAMAHWNLGRVLMAEKKEAEGKEEMWKAVELARKQHLPYYFQAEPVPPPQVAPSAPLPCEAAWQSRLKTLFEAFDWPVPVL